MADCRPPTVASPRPRSAAMSGTSMVKVLRWKFRSSIASAHAAATACQGCNAVQSWAHHTTPRVSGAWCMHGTEHALASLACRCHGRTCALKCQLAAALATVPIMYKKHALLCAVLCCVDSRTWPRAAAGGYGTPPPPALLHVTRVPVRHPWREAACHPAAAVKPRPMPALKPARCSCSLVKRAV